MKKFMTDSGLGGILLPPTLPILFGLLVVAVSGVSIALVATEKSGTPMHSVQLTQKGYIQVRIDRVILFASISECITVRHIVACQRKYFLSSSGLGSAQEFLSGILVSRRNVCATAELNMDCVVLLRIVP